MIVAEQKPIEEIKELLEGHKRVLVLGCGTCVSVCLAGGEREVATLAPVLRMAGNIEVLENTIERHFFTLHDFVDTIRRSSPHDINFATAIQTVKEWGYDVPGDVRIYAIEVKELLKFSESCTPQIQNKLDEITNRILKDISNDTS